MDESAAPPDPQEAIAVANRQFASTFAIHDTSTLVADYFVEDALQPTAWGASEQLVQDRAALRAMFDAQLDLVRRLHHETLVLAVTDDGRNAHELGWCQLELRDGSEIFARYAALWQFREGLGWRVRQLLSAVDG